MNLASDGYGEKTIMSVNVRTRDGKRKIKVAGEMTIYTAAQIKRKFFANLDKCKEVAVDLSEVADLDTAGLQLLVLGKREFEDSGKSWTLVNHSAAVLTTLDHYCLTTQLDQIEVPQAGAEVAP